MYVVLQWAVTETLGDIRLDVSITMRYAYSQRC